MIKTLAIAIGLVSLTAVATADDKNMQPPPAPKELADMAKNMGGTWNCTGTAFAPNGKDKTDLKGTMKSALEMNGMWIHDTFDAKMGTMPFHFEAYTTYDATGKHYHRAMIESFGGLSEGEGKLNGTKIDFDLDTHDSHGDGKFKDHVDFTDLKAVKAAGEMSMDKGKTWTKVYEMTCKKA